MPVPAAGQVLVRVMAAGLNRGEINQVKRAPAPAMTVGVEFAGEVAEVGSDVRGWREGDRVMGHGSGCQAEYVLADPLALMPVPSTLSWIEAAAFPNVFITAHDAVITNGELRAGESILVNGASGGVAWRRSRSPRFGRASRDGDVALGRKAHATCGIRRRRGYRFVERIAGREGDVRDREARRRRRDRLGRCAGVRGQPAKHGGEAG